MCAAHTACSYANLLHAQKHKVPPMVYEDLIRLSPGALEGYLYCRLPRGLSAGECSCLGLLLTVKP